LPQCGQMISVSHGRRSGCLQGRACLALFRAEGAQVRVMAKPLAPAGQEMRCPALPDRCRSLLNVLGWLAGHGKQPQAQWEVFR
jgi:hypothetical protein